MEEIYSCNKMKFGVRILNNQWWNLWRVFLSDKIPDPIFGLSLVATNPGIYFACASAFPQIHIFFCINLTRVLCPLSDVAVAWQFLVKLHYNNDNNNNDEVWRRRLELELTKTNSEAKERYFQGNQTPLLPCFQLGIFVHFTK